MAETICVLQQCTDCVNALSERTQLDGYDAVIIQNYRHWQHSVCSECPHMKFYHGLTLINSEWTESCYILAWMVPQQH